MRSMLVRRGSAFIVYIMVLIDLKYKIAMATQSCLSKILYFFLNYKTYFYSIYNIEVMNMVFSK